MSVRIPKRLHALCARVGNTWTELSGDDVALAWKSVELGLLVPKLGGARGIVWMQSIYGADVLGAAGAR